MAAGVDGLSFRVSFRCNADYLGASLCKRATLERRTEVASGTGHSLLPRKLCV